MVGPDKMQDIYKCGVQFSNFKILSLNHNCKSIDDLEKIGKYVVAEVGLVGEEYGMDSIKNDRRNSTI